MRAGSESGEAGRRRPGADDGELAVVADGGVHEGVAVLALGDDGHALRAVGKPARKQRRFATARTQLWFLGRNKKITDADISPVLGMQTLAI